MTQVPVPVGGDPDLRRAYGELSTPEVSDALDAWGRAGGLPGLRPAVLGARLFGPAFTVSRVLNTDPGYTRAADFIDEVPAGHVVVIDNLGLDGSTCWGGLLTHCAVRRGLAGTVIHGVHRDAAVVRALGYPLFSRGTFMVSGKGRTRMRARNAPLTIGGVEIRPGDLLLGDEDGVVVIPAVIARGVAERAAEIREAEEVIRDLVAQGSSLRDARQQLGYHDLTRSRPDGRRRRAASGRRGDDLRSARSRRPTGR